MLSQNLLVVNGVDVRVVTFAKQMVDEHQGLLIEAQRVSSIPGLPSDRVARVAQVFNEQQIVPVDNMLSQIITATMNAMKQARALAFHVAELQTRAEPVDDDVW